MPLPERHTAWRVIEIIQMIEGGRYPNVRSISETFECSVRTAERYIERLRDLVAPDLVFDRIHGGYTFRGGGPKMPPLKLSEGEAVAIFLAGRLLEQVRGTPYEAAVGRALEKLSYLLPKEVTLAGVPQPGGWVSFRMEPLRGEERQVMEVFLKLDRARDERETVRIHYYTAGRNEWNDRDIDPYHLHFADGAWYVFAYCHWREEVKIFALDRIESIEGTGRHFETPEDFSPQTFMANSFRIERGEPVDVVIRFGPEQARYVRGKQWHPSQTVEELGQGPEGSGWASDDAGSSGAAGGAAGQDQGLILRMRVGGLGEVKRWILMFGAGAEVLEPAELREQVRAEATALEKRYALSGPKA